MNRKHARDIAGKVTNQQIFEMLEKAKENITDWTKPSKANKGLSRGVHWNIFYKMFDVKEKCSNMLKSRLIHEYGEFLPEELQPPKRKKSPPPAHEDPIF